MEIENIDNGRNKYPENVTDFMKLVRKSKSGDSYSSSLIALCILCKYKEANSKFFRYIDLAIEQGDKSLPFFLDMLFSKVNSSLKKMNVRMLPINKFDV